MLLLLLACRITQADIAEALDPDGDGYGPEEDCGHRAADVYPGAEEIWYDGIDQDCGGGSDYDLDGDGFSSAVEPDIQGQVGPDCDDGDSTVHPGADEVCGDGVVNNCDESEEEAWKACRWQGERSLAEVDLKIIGSGVGDVAGKSVTGVGDVDGDGRADIVVGAPNEGSSGKFAGAAYLLLSSGELASEQDTLHLRTADLILEGEDGYDELGGSVAGAGDVDGDSRADLLVGAHGEDTGGDAAGAVYLLLSSGALSHGGSPFDLSAADLKLFGEGENNDAGWAISSAGDIDNDKLSDLVVGAPGNYTSKDGQGAVYLVLASSVRLANSPTFELRNADVKIVGYENEGLGWSVSGGQDVDGDGLPDILAGTNHQGAFLFLSSGALLAGGAILSRSYADLQLYQPGGLVGRSCAVVGDVDGDGRADILIGAVDGDSSGTYAGGAYLVLSSALTGVSAALALDDADLQLLGETGGDMAGYSVSSAGDLDGDDRMDLLIGAYYNDAGGDQSGAAYLLLSSGSLATTGSSLILSDADMKLTGESNFDRAGSSVAAAGDVNGDGLDDLLIGAYGHDNSTGAAYLLFGRSF